MKDFRHTKQIIAIKIDRDRANKKLTLSQEYIKKVLQRFNMDKFKVVSTPLATHFRLSAKQCLSTNEKKMSFH